MPPFVLCESFVARPYTKMKLEHFFPPPPPCLFTKQRAVESLWVEFVQGSCLRTHSSKYFSQSILRKFFTT